MDPNNYIDIMKYVSGTDLPVIA